MEYSKLNEYLKSVELTFEETELIERIVNQDRKSKILNPLKNYIHKNISQEEFDYELRKIAFLGI